MAWDQPTSADPSDARRGRTVVVPYTAPEAPRVVWVVWGAGLEGELTGTRQQVAEPDCAATPAHPVAWEACSSIRPLPSVGSATYMRRRAGSRVLHHSVGRDRAHTVWLPLHRRALAHARRRAAIAGCRRHPLRTGTNRCPLAAADRGALASAFGTRRRSSARHVSSGRTRRTISGWGSFTAANRGSFAPTTGGSAFTAAGRGALVRHGRRARRR